MRPTFETLRFAVLLLATSPAAQHADSPRTVPEASEYTATSTAADVAQFVAACQKLPHGDRLTVSVAGRTHAGRDQLLVKVADPTAAANERLRALVIGNIHAGEVEGKEALQQLVREFAAGEHGDVLARCELWLLPIYNVDGNEQPGPKNRVGQNGPPLTGKRHNGQDLDLNRDFVKADAPETRTLLRLFRDVDPHLFVDLHTTNGSYHGYRLTYAPSVSTNVDPDVAALSRALLDGARDEMQRQHGWPTFDYGNFETRDWDGGGAPESAKGVRGWYSFDHRARMGFNYFALRNRIAVLSEAYSYDDFATRIAVTRGFVLALLHRLVATADDVRRITAAADRRLAEGDAVPFGFDTTFAPPESLPVLVGEVERVEGENGAGHRFVRKGDGKPEVMPVFRAFRSRQSIPLPQAWLVLAPSPDLIARLRDHGVEFTAIDAPRTVAAERFAVTAKRKPKRPFQGHQELVLTGNWQPRADVELPAGTLLVPATQRLARVAATLLEPQSEDSLSTWNFFEATTGEHFPVLRLPRE